MRMLTGLFLILVSHRAVNASEAAFALRVLGDVTYRRRRSKRWLIVPSAIFGDESTGTVDADFTKVLLEVPADTVTSPCNSFRNNAFVRLTMSITISARSSCLNRVRTERMLQNLAMMGHHVNLGVVVELGIVRGTF